MAVAQIEADLRQALMPVAGGAQPQSRLTVLEESLDHCARDLVNLMAQWHSKTHLIDGRREITSSLQRIAFADLPQLNPPQLIVWRAHDLLFELACGMSGLLRALQRSAGACLLVVDARLTETERSYLQRHASVYIQLAAPPTAYGLLGNRFRQLEEGLPLRPASSPALTRHANVTTVSRHGKMSRRSESFAIDARRTALRPVLDPALAANPIPGDRKPSAAPEKPASTSSPTKPSALAGPQRNALLPFTPEGRQAAQQHLAAYQVTLHSNPSSGGQVMYEPDEFDDLDEDDPDDDLDI